MRLAASGLAVREDGCVVPQRHTLNHVGQRLENVLLRSALVENTVEREGENLEIQSGNTLNSELFLSRN